MADIIVDTYKLNQYAQRISDVNSRINRLDRRLDSLYWQVGLVGLWNLILADALTCYSWRLDRCKSYLEQTASEYEIMEKYLSSLDPLNFNESALNRLPFDNYGDPNRHRGAFRDLLEGFLAFIQNGGFFPSSKGSPNQYAYNFPYSILSYIAGVYTFNTTRHSDDNGLISKSMQLADSSSTIFGKVYDFLEGRLTHLEASRFGKKYQAGVGTISLIGSFLGFTGTNIESIRTWMDENSTGYDNFHALFNSLDSGLNLTNSGIQLLYGQKVLTRTVTANWHWGVAVKNIKVLDTCTAVIAPASMFLGIIDGAVVEYGEVSADGVVDSSDRARVAINGSVKGLTKIVNFFTGGVSDAFGLSDSADEISDGLVNFAETTGVDFVRSHDYSSNYVKNAQVLMDYANDENNPAFFRGAAEVTTGLGMIGAVTVDCVADGCKWIGDGISTGWNKLKGFFS